MSELGIGWRLSGISSVRRRVTNGLPRFDETDSFELAGVGIASDLVELEPGVYRQQQHPYAYSNLNPGIAADPDGNLPHILVMAGIGAVVGAGIEAARQYVVDGKIHDLGRIGAAAAGGAVSGAITAVCPAAGLGGLLAFGAASGAAAGVTERLVASGGKDAGTLGDVIWDAGVGAATAGVLKGASKVIKRSPPVKPPAQKVHTPVKSDWSDVGDPLDGVMDRWSAEAACRSGGCKIPSVAGAGRSKAQFRGPDPTAEGPHTRFRTDDKGVTHYETYDYPAPGQGKRVDMVGPPHSGVSTPHVVDTTKHMNPKDPTKFRYSESRPRPATPDEIPRRNP